MKFAIAFVAVLGCCLAAPEGDKEVAVMQFPQLSEIISTAQKTINDLAANIKTQLNLPDQEKVIQTFKTTSADLVKQFNSLQETISKELKEKQPEIEKTWEMVKTKLTKVANDINANVPNAKESAEQLQKKFQEGIETVVKESSAIAEKIKANSGQVKEEIAGITKKAVDIAVEATNTINEQLKSVAASMPKKE